jgi:hypothetical protein
VTPEPGDEIEASNSGASTLHINLAHQPCTSTLHINLAHQPCASTLRIHTSGNDHCHALSAVAVEMKNTPQPSPENESFQTRPGAVKDSLR